MSFITYAQNFEDVILWRALGHISQGFYIDVGANDPVEHSVTKAFYDAGWRGINVEPLPAYRDAFASQRPRDINLAVAAGPENGELVLFDVPDIHGWASPDAAVAAAHQASGHVVAELRVPQRTLDSICADYVHGDIQFLKIDVEGFEEAVLRGIDLERWRPWILVIEATVPNSRVTNHETWEPLVTSHRYRFAYFDGLNRYYVADEHAALAETIAIQPNVFDAFVPWQLARAAEGAIAQEAARQAENDAHQQTRAQLEQFEARTVQALHLHDMVARTLAAEYDAHGATRHALSEAYKAHALTQHALGQEYEAHAASRAATLEVMRDKAQLQDRFAQLEARCAQLDAGCAHQQAARDAAMAEVAQLHAQLGASDAWAKSMEAQLNARSGSRYRQVGGRALRLARSPVTESARLGRGAARRAVTWLASRESLRRLILPRLARHPRLAAKVTGLVMRVKRVPVSAVQHARQAAVDPRVAHLPASARKVYFDLKQRLSVK
ncbi:MAG: FkbM family methyltransferase [Massilia sp.]